MLILSVAAVMAVRPMRGKPSSIALHLVCCGFGWVGCQHHDHQMKGQQHSLLVEQKVKPRRR